MCGQACTSLSVNISSVVSCAIHWHPPPCHTSWQDDSKPFPYMGKDIVGPFPRDEKGRQYLLTCVDHLTGWVEAIPLASKKIVTVWDAFTTHIVACYGLPTSLVTDNCGEFTEKIGWKQMVLIIGWHPHTTCRQMVWRSNNWRYIFFSY